ncbi:peptidyl-prolyl cis-trans isomerase [Hyphomonas sp.]|uniref:peptidylprolyl isomerase n=1 Tax=Hyphomonas sp. TaxID=87 RepID=UPI0035298322
MTGLSRSLKWMPPKTSTRQTSCLVVDRNNSNCAYARLPAAPEKSARKMMEDTSGTRSSGTGLRRFLSQPFLHFLLGALAIFLVDSVASGGAAARQDVISVSEPEIARLKAEWLRSWARPPTDDELDTLISDWVEDEVYFRQARAMALDEDDPVVRQYLSSKMRFLTSDVIVVPEPRPDELAAYFETHKEDFTAEPIYSFEQVRIEAMDTGEVQVRRSALEAGGNAEGGEGERFVGVGRLEVSRKFGVTFYERLAALPVGVWSGPVVSSVGVHLIRVDLKEIPAGPELKEVENAVRAAWVVEKRTELQQAAYERLRSTYKIQVHDVES